MEYLKTDLLPAICGPETKTHNPELKKVMEAGGEKPSPDQGISIALSLSFTTEKEARAWHDRVLAVSLSDFQERFSLNALYFITFLKTLNL